MDSTKVVAVKEMLLESLQFSRNVVREGDCYDRWRKLSRLGDSGTKSGRSGKQW